MKIARIEAQDVHGYLSLTVDFFPDLTFLTGLNGSGKTTVLRLLVALLTPLPEELISISFSRTSVKIFDEEKELLVVAQKSPEGLQLSISSVPVPLVLTSSDLQLLIDARRRDEYRERPRDESSPILEKIASNPTYQAIHSISTPMFLGLDRRFTGPTRPLVDDSAQQSRRAWMMRRTLQDDPSFRGVGIAAALVDVNYLVWERMQQVRAEQEKLDEELRRKFFTRAFEYKPADLSFNQAAAPTRRDLEQYRGYLAVVERAAEALRLPVPELRTALSDFFDRMGSVTNELEKVAAGQGTQKQKEVTEVASKQVVEWIINKPQTDRILEHIELLTEYQDKKTALREPIDRFLELINGFLVQTSKTVDVTGAGELQVRLAGNSKPRPITALSSGERQLLVMLGHLSLNRDLEHSGVFIVDEPELSLHIAWQERFVDAVTKANPKVQLILATHSPAIILDRTGACRSLS